MPRSRMRCGPPACRCRRWCARSRATWWPISGRRESASTSGSTSANAIRGSTRPLSVVSSRPSIGCATWARTRSTRGTPTRWVLTRGTTSCAGSRPRAPTFAEPLAEMRDELVALEAMLEWPANLQTCHRDLFADNILRTAAGSLCVIDWENSGLADPGQELCLVLFEYGCGRPERCPRSRTRLRRGRWSGSNPAARRLLDDHRPARPHRRDLLPPMARPVAAPAERERNAGRVEEFITQPLTRQMIDDMLDADQRLMSVGTRQC